MEYANQTLAVLGQLSQVRNRFQLYCLDANCHAPPVIIVVCNLQ
jgi:hypothetical protein